MNHELVLKNELQLEIDSAKLGKGDFAKVHNARRTVEPHEQVACKLFDFGQWASYVIEVKAYRQIQSAGDQQPHILHFESDFHMFQEFGQSTTARVIKNSIDLDEDRPPRGLVLMYGLVLEKVDMNLKEWMRANKMDGFTEQQAIDLYRQIGSALAFIHSKHHLCHNDLKLNNIGVVTGQSNGSIPTLKLLDFGLAETYDQATFEAAEVRSAEFASQPDGTDLKICQVKCDNKFMDESRTFGRILENIIRCPGQSSKAMDNVENQTFKKVLVGLTSKSLSINTAMSMFSM